MESFNKEHLIEVPVVSDETGNLAFLQYPESCPFEIKRVFYMFSLPDGTHRGGHSHTLEDQIIIAVAGRFTVSVHDGHEWRRYELDSPDKGLYVPAHLWRSLDEFSDRAVCLVLSSTLFDENDYERDFQRFLYAIKSNHNGGY